MSTSSKFQFYQHHENIFYSDNYYKKIKRIHSSLNNNNNNTIHDNADDWQFICDFDRTLTHPLSYQCHGLISEFSTHQAFKESILHLFDSKSRAASGLNLSQHRWWQRYHRKMIETQFCKSDLDHQILRPSELKNRVWMRDGTDALLQYLMHENIPVLVVSAGISYVIRNVLETYGLLLPNMRILANEMHWKERDDDDNDTTQTETELETEQIHIALNDNGNGNGNESTIKTKTNTKDMVVESFSPLICSFNKYETYNLLKTDYFANANIAKRKFCVYCGDSVTDSTTMVGIENIEECILIGFILPHRLKNGDLNAFLKSYDIVIATRNASMTFVLELLQQFIGRPSSTTLSSSASSTSAKLMSVAEEEHGHEHISETTSVPTKLERERIRRTRMNNHVFGSKTFNYSFSNLRVSGNVNAIESNKTDPHDANNNNMDIASTYVSDDQIILRKK